jgi:hypothetical protein
MIDFGPGVSLGARSRASLSLLSHKQREQAKQSGYWQYEPRYRPLQPVGEGRWMFWIPEGA